MGYPLTKIFIDEVRKFIGDLPRELRQKFATATSALSEGSFESADIKQLGKEIEKVKIQKYRLLFFTHKNSIYFVRIFVKKANKTPKRENDLAGKYYKLITNN